ncbi:hypothetical protein SAMN05216455_10493 [Segatella bryantii]|nr:hypothetical protein SAMN05216455_10493 [Segatella bryantii]
MFASFFFLGNTCNFNQELCVLRFDFLSFLLYPILICFYFILFCFFELN